MEKIWMIYVRYICICVCSDQSYVWHILLFIYWQTTTEYKTHAFNGANTCVWLCFMSWCSWLCEKIMKDDFYIQQYGWVQLFVWITFFKLYFLGHWKKTKCKYEKDLLSKWAVKKKSQKCNPDNYFSETCSRFSTETNRGATRLLSKRRLNHLNPTFFLPQIHFPPLYEYHRYLLM